jgi:hypothetical protein
VSVLNVDLQKQQVKSSHSLDFFTTEGQATELPDSLEDGAEIGAQACADFVVGWTLIPQPAMTPTLY